MTHAPAPTRTELDARIARADLEKLARVSGQGDVRCGPFYNCFINRSPATRHTTHAPDADPIPAPGAK